MPRKINVTFFEILIGYSHTHEKGEKNNDWIACNKMLENVSSNLYKSDKNVREKKGGKCLPGDLCLLRKV